MSLTRYWFKFDLTIDDPYPLGVLRGCGVTAWSYEDAVTLLKQRVFTEDPFPNISKVIENIDISTLDENEVIPNMAAPIYRGIWFPLGYS